MPVSATDDTQMYLYNGVELPALPEWDKDAYPYAYISELNSAAQTLFPYTYILWFTSEPAYWMTHSTVGDSMLVYDGNIAYSLRSGSTDFAYNGAQDGVYIHRSAMGFTLIWSNTTVTAEDGSVFLSASAPVPVGGSSDTVTNATMTIDSVQALDDSASVVYTVDGLGSADVIYTVKGSLMQDGTEVRSMTSEAFGGPTAFFHNTLASLAPETAYTLTYTLLENGVETAASASQSFTTLASATADDSVDETESLSLLSAIYAAIIDQNDTHLTMYESFGNMFSSIWLRLRYIEELVGTLVPSAEETALKEATADVTAAYTEEFWSNEGAGFGRSGIEDAGIVFQHSQKMFDTGVSVSDFFGLFDAYGWGNWFSAETRDDLDTVSKPAVIDDGGDSDLSTYEKNLQEIQSFVGGG